MTKRYRVGIACMLVLGLAARTASAATYYWDGNDDTSGFGTAGGTWEAPTIGTTTSGWSTDSTGATLVNGNSVTTATADGINFGNGATGLGAGPITISGTVSAGSITFASGSGAVVLSGGTSITLAGTATITVNNSSDTISTPIGGGATSVTKAGTGTLSLSGNNSYSGVTAISGGILAIAHNNALGATSGNTTITATGSSTGPRLTISGTITSPENISIGGTTEASNYTAVISNTSGTNTLSGTITLASPSNGIRLGSGGGELIFSGTISQTGTTRTLVLQAATGAALTVNNAIANNNGNLSVINSGAVTLKAASTAIGATTIGEGGLLKLGVTDALKTTSDLTIGFAYNFAGSDQGTFDLAGFNQTIKALIGTKNTSNIGADTTRIVTNSGAGTGTNTLTVGNGNGAGTFNGVILDGSTAKVALTKVGTGTLTLVGNNTYSGVTTISGGAIAITHANALGSTAGNTTITATGATTGPRLLISGTINSPENITLTGTTEVGNYEAAIINTANANTLSGNITLAGTGGLKIKASGGTLNLTGNITQTGTTHTLVLQPIATTAAITVSNPIAINGGQLLLVGLNSGNGALVTLSGVSGSGIGATTLAQQVTLRLGVNNALNTTANLTVSYGGSATGEDRATFDLRGFNQTVNALIGNIGSANSSANSFRLITNGASGTTSILTVGNGGGSGTFRGQINSGTGNIQLIKTGTGTQTLNDQNSYTGGTRIDAGTLTLGHTTDTLANTGAVNVNGGTLAIGSNSDTVGAVTLTSGSITNTTGVLTGSSYEVQNGSVFAILGGSGVALTKSTSGTVTLSGANTYTGGTTINAGMLTLGHATDTLANSGAVNVNGGTLDLGANNDTVGAVTLTSGSITGTGTLTGSSYDVRSGTISARLGGTVGLAKSTSGTVTLSGINSYTNTTTVSGGMLVINGGLRSRCLPDNDLLTIDGGKVSLSAGVLEKVGSLKLGTGAVITGPTTYGSSASGAENKDDTYFDVAGTGILYIGLDLPPAPTLISFF